jgi:hypothetical protein
MVQLIYGLDIPKPIKIISHTVCNVITTQNYIYYLYN